MYYIAVPLLFKDLFEGRESMGQGRGRGEAGAESKRSRLLTKQAA